MQYVQRFADIILIDDERYIAFCCSLRYRPDIDTILPQQAKYLAGYPCSFPHTIAYYCYKPEFILD